MLQQDCSVVCPKCSEQKWAALRNDESLSYLCTRKMKHLGKYIIWFLLERLFSLRNALFQTATLQGEAVNMCAARWLEWKGRKHHWKGWGPTTPAPKANATIWVTTLCQEEQSTKLRWEWKDSMTYWFYKLCQLAGQILIKSWVMVSQLFSIF